MVPVRTLLASGGGECDVCELKPEQRSLVEEIHVRLRRAGWQLAVAESITGGRIQSLVTAVSGASDVFVGGVTTYTIDQKVAHLGVEREVAIECDAVSEQVAHEMALGVCAMFGCACGVATTGYARHCLALKWIE